MIKGVNFIGSTVSKESNEFFHAPYPEKNSYLPEHFFISTKNEISHAINKATTAFDKCKNLSGIKKAKYLEAIAYEIEELGDQLINRACKETGLPSGRLQGERNRTVNQINIFAKLLREGSWVDARIDTAQPDRQPFPKPDLRYMNFPIGPVVVFGASNFPLAFSTAGGDTVSALAAGCPVIVKSHESHPGTNELVSRAILEAAQKTNMPDGVFSSLNGGPEIGQKLVQHPAIKAVGFTGSFRGGKAIFDLALKRDEPIPVYAEMGSVNPVFLFEQKLRNSVDQLAVQYAQSITLGAGQFCTAPGLIIAKEGESLNQFVNSLSEELKTIEPGCMLNPGISENYRAKREELFSQKEVDAVLSPDDRDDLTAASALAKVKAVSFLANKKLHEEVFGPFTLVISCSDDEELHEVAAHLDGQLTVTFNGTEEELKNYKSLISICREKTGRIIFNGVPTGVEVCSSMQHGGPFPATTDSKFTSVGTAAIRRFVRPVAFQDCPADLLPDELKPDNPLGIYRLVDGQLRK